MTFRKSRGANRSVGFKTSARPHLMNCFADVECEAATGDRRRQTPNGGAWPLHATIAEIEPPHVFDFVVGIGAQIDTAGELNP